MVEANKNNPNKINSTPATLFNNTKGIMAPNSPRDAPRARKIKEKPAIKLMVWKITCLLLGGAEVRIDMPAILARYTGTSGNTQGDRKESIPAAKATGKVTLSIKTPSNYPMVTLYRFLWPAGIPASTTGETGPSERRLTPIKIKALLYYNKSAQD